MRGTVVALVALALVAGCAPRVREVDCAENPDACAKQVLAIPRAYVDPPFGLTFSCVLLGCAEQKTLRVENRGGGRLAIPMARLAVDASPELSLSFELAAAEGDPVTVDQPQPARQYMLRSEEALLIHVTYQPMDTVHDATTVRIDAYDGAQDYDHATIQRIEMPLEIRELGAAESLLATDTVRFGYVAPGASATKEVVLTNVSAQSAILGVTDVALVADSSGAFTLGVGWGGLANPGDAIYIPVTLAPEQADVHAAQLIIETNDSASPQHVVNLVGTSIQGPALTVLYPTEGVLSFGEVPYGQSRAATVRVRNDGASALPVHLVLSGSASYALLSNDTAMLEPLEQADVQVGLQASQGGELAGALAVVTPLSGTLAEVELWAYGQAPLAQTSVTSLDFGTLVRGWSSETRTVSIVNAGTGALEVTSVQPEAGTSNQFSITSGLAALPAVLLEGEVLTLQVHAVANYLGPARGALLITSNSVAGSTLRLPLALEVLSCDRACPIDYGAADCSSGSCAVGTCEPGYHDTDGLMSTGCECQEERSGNDVGATCGTGLNVGSLGDACASLPVEATRTGNLHDENDVDLYYFRTVDGGDVFCDTFSDSSRTSVWLRQAPEGLALCVAIRESGAGCGGYTTSYDPDLCGSVYYMHDGNAGADDNRDVTAWVMWMPGVAPVCSNYMLVFRGKQ